MITTWNKHKKTVLSGAHIITILTLIGGVVGNYLENGKNSSSIESSSQWMKDAIKIQSKEIIDLRIENAILKTKIDYLSNVSLKKKKSKKDS